MSPQKVMIFCKLYYNNVIWKKAKQYLLTWHLVGRFIQFVINSSFRKIFSTKSYDVANECALILIVLSLTLDIKERLSF